MDNDLVNHQHSDLDNDAEMPTVAENVYADCLS